MVSPWPFSICVVDLVGVINPKYREGNKFIIITIEYFIKMG